MNRRNFFKNLTAATVGMVVGRTVIVGIVGKPPKPKREGYMNVDWDKESAPPEFQWVYSSPGEIDWYNRACVEMELELDEQADREFINRLMQ